MITLQLREKLNKKLEKTVLFITKLKLDKKASNAGFQEEIKSAEKKANMLAQTLESGDETPLYLVFTQGEIDSFSK